MGVMERSQVEKVRRRAAACKVDPRAHEHAFLRRPRQIQFAQFDELGGSRALQKPCIAGSRSRGNNQLKAKLLRPFGQRSDLLLTIPAFVVFGSFINVRLSVFDEPVEQAG